MWNVHVWSCWHKNLLMQSWRASIPNSNLEAVTHLTTHKFVQVHWLLSTHVQAHIFKWDILKNRKMSNKKILAIFIFPIEIFSPLLVVNSEPICCEHILADWTANLLRTYYLYVILSYEMSLLLCNTQVKQQRAILNLDNQTLIACSDGTQYLSFLNQYTYFADYQYQIRASVSLHVYFIKWPKQNVW